MKVVIPMKLDNWNDTINKCRTNKYGANTHKKTEMRAISHFVCRIPKIDKYPLKLTLNWHIKNMRADLDNKSIKSILDCMQNLGIIENDNMKHINEITYKAIKDTEDFVEMEIEYNGSS